MPTVLENGDVLLDAFPFQSNPNLITDENGYKRGDRSVDSWTMRNAFRQFFSTGVFGTPADAFQITKGTSGMTVNIQPGMCIIEGGMGGIEERNGQLTLTLDTQAAAGNICYGIFLHYDINDDVRGITVRVRKGSASSNPVPPSPDTTSEGVYELRLGYVSVPNGATDLSGATVVNEKGLNVCPYAAPFVPLDVNGIVADFRYAATDALGAFQNQLDTKNTSAQEMLAEFLSFLDQYESFVQSAVDGTTAGNLQNQIDDLKEQVEAVDLTESVDNETIAYSRKPDDAKSKLHVMDYGIGTAQLADGSVTAAKLADGAVGIGNISDDAIDAAGALASFDALSDVASDLFKIAHSLHMSQLDALDLDTIAEWTFPGDATAQHGQWNSGGYYYADGGAA